MRAGRSRLAVRTSVCLIGALVAVPTVLSVCGFRILIVRSGSMAPRIQARDALLVRTVLPRAVQRGQIITFRSPSAPDRLITHRVMSIRKHGPRFSFVTKGDANTGSERWQIEAGGRLAVVSGRVPRVGAALGWMSQPAVKAALLWAAFGAIALWLFRGVQEVGNARAP